MTILRKIHPLVDESNQKLFWAFGLVAGSWLIALMISGILWFVGPHPIKRQSIETTPKQAKIEFKQFKSETEFRDYMAKLVLNNSYYDSAKNWLTQPLTPQNITLPAELLPSTKSFANDYSQTNVQVIGIDEPDNIKTNGKNIYFSQENSHNIPILNQIKSPIAANDSASMPIIDHSPVKTTYETKIISTNATNPKVTSVIDQTGDLLFINQTLVVLQSQKIVGYNISNQNQPQKIWEYRYDNSSSKIAARLINNQLLIITQTSTQSSSPCPMPLMNGPSNVVISCNEIHYWDNTDTVRFTFTALTIDPLSGKINQKISWLGNNAQTAIFISPKNLYINQYLLKSDAELIPNFILDTKNLIDETTKQKILYVKNLNISDRAKQVEYEDVISDYRSKFSDEDRLKWQTDYTNKFASYKLIHATDIEKTVITKMNIDSFVIVETGSVPGKLLNQFSIDEFNNTLRVATTIGDLWQTGRKSINNVYILNDHLEELGKVTDIGKNEHIYNVRFYANRGYIVTYKETDPLHIMDLSNPSNPKLTGELALPGYSSYIHPVNDTLLVGVSRENNKVKLALYDISDPSHPQETSKYILDEYWSEAFQNHHAFFNNPETNTFYMPGSKGGYLFTWSPDNIKLSYSVTDLQVSRVVHIAGNWYLAGDNGLTVIDGKTWKRNSSLTW